MLRSLLVLFLTLFPWHCAAQTVVEVAEQPFGLLQAMQTTLSKHPSIQLQAVQVDIKRGQLQQASGQFDTVIGAGSQQNYSTTPLTRYEQFSAAAGGITTASQSSDSTSYNVNAQKEYRNGITIEPSLQINRLRDNLTNLPGTDQSTISFQVTIPLLRGRGREVVAAQETSARQNVDASVFTLNFTIAQQLAGAASQYWNAVAGIANLQIAKDSETRGLNYARDVRTLIAADRVPRLEINQVLANLADRTASRVQAEQNLLDARQNLALAMGLSADEITSFPMPTEGLPEWLGEAPPAVTPALMQSFVAQAMSHRADLMAADKTSLASQVLIPSFKNQLRPQLNLNLNIGYSGLLEGKDYFRIFGSPFRNVYGPNAVGSLSYSFAPKNDVARGELMQVQGSYRQAVIQRGDLARTIASNVASAMVDLSSSVARLRKERDAVSSYRLALDTEREKFSMGLNSLIDVLTMEDRLTAALSNELSAHLSYALAIENLRLATGTIIEPDKLTQTLRRETFSTPPFPWGSRQ